MFVEKNQTAVTRKQNVHRTAAPTEGYNSTFVVEMKIRQPNSVRTTFNLDGSTRRTTAARKGKRI
jgi:uncharacterized protein Veg